MSYSFQTRDDTKDEAKANVARMFQQVLESQPVHKADMQAAQDNANKAIDLLDEVKAEQQVLVSCNGSLSWNGDQETPSIQAVDISVAALLVTRS